MELHTQTLREIHNRFPFLKIEDKHYNIAFINFHSTLARNLTEHIQRFHFEIDCNFLPQPFKDDIFAYNILCEKIYISNRILFNFNTGFSIGVKNNPIYNDDEMFNTLRYISYPRTEALELSWLFSDLANKQLLLEEINQALSKYARNEHDGIRNSLKQLFRYLVNESSTYINEISSSNH